MDYQTELRRLAIEQVTKIEPVLQDTVRITEITTEINGMQNGTRPRVGTKQEYLAYVQQLEEERSGLNAINMQLTDNANAQYEADIQEKMLDQSLIDAANTLVFNADHTTRLAAIEQALLELGEALL